MGKPIPDASSIAAKWKRRASAAAQDLVDGAKSATWKAEAIAGETNYATAIAKAVANKSRSKGIEKVSDETWRKGIETNAGRYTQGVNDSEAEMAAGMQNVVTDIKAGMATLPARGPKGSPGNYGRSQKLGEYLHTQAEKRG
jgi:hypothetical protein